jgi:hypothetical protein
MEMGRDRVAENRDLSTPEGEAEFEFDFEAYCVGRMIRGVRVMRDRVELHLDAGRTLAFRVEGDDLVTLISIPRGHSDEPKRVM